MAYLAKQILKSMGLSLKSKPKQERILNPKVRWMNKYVSACKSMAVGNTLDEKMSTLLSYPFAERVLHASYSGLKMSEAFEKRFPLTAEKLKLLFSSNLAKK